MSRVRGVQICIPLANNLSTHWVARPYVRELPAEAGSRHESLFSGTECAHLERKHSNPIKTKHEEGGGITQVTLGFPVMRLSDVGLRHTEQCCHRDGRC